MGLGVPSNDNELFEQNSPFPEAFAYKSNAFDPEECYLAFDRFGNAHDEHLCLINTSHMGTLIRYIETVEETPCTNARLNWIIDGSIWTYDILISQFKYMYVLEQL